MASTTRAAVAVLFLMLIAAAAVAEEVPARPESAKETGQVDAKGTKAEPEALKHGKACKAGHPCFANPPPCRKKGELCGEHACCSGLTCQPGSSGHPVCVESGPTCNADTSPCAGTGPDASCCSNLCGGPGPFRCCKFNGGACSITGADLSCCTGFCNGATCCETTGVPCQVNTDCCSGTCTSNFCD